MIQRPAVGSRVRATDVLNGGVGTVVPVPVYSGWRWQPGLCWVLFDGDSRPCPWTYDVLGFLDAPA